jgi:hypothetical protein
MTALGQRVGDYLPRMARCVNGQICFLNEFSATVAGRGGGTTEFRAFFSRVAFLFYFITQYYQYFFFF